MSSIAEAQEIAREIAGQGCWKTRVRRVQTKLKCTWNRAKDILYADPRIEIDAKEIDRLRAIRRKARTEADSDRARLSRLRCALASVDEEFHGPTIEALDRALRSLGGVD